MDLTLRLSELVPSYAAIAALITATISVSSLTSTPAASEAFALASDLESDLSPLFLPITFTYLISEITKAINISTTNTVPIPITVLRRAFSTFSAVVNVGFTATEATEKSSLKINSKVQSLLR